MSSCRSKKKTRWIATFATNNVADVAADVESLRVQWSDQLGRHSGLPSAGDYYAAATFRGMGDSPEMRLLVGGGSRSGSGNSAAPSAARYRFRLIAKSAPMHRRAPSPNASHPGAGGLVSAEAVRIESFGVREDFRILVQIGNAHKYVAIVRNPPRAEVEVRCADPAARQVDDGPYSQHLQNRGSAEIAAPLVDFSDQLGQHVRVAPQPLKRPAQGRLSWFRDRHR